VTENEDAPTNIHLDQPRADGSIELGHPTAGQKAHPSPQASMQAAGDDAPPPPPAKTPGAENIARPPAASRPAPDDA